MVTQVLLEQRLELLGVVMLVNPAGEGAVGMGQRGEELFDSLPLLPLGVEGRVVDVEPRRLGARYFATSKLRPSFRLASRDAGTPAGGRR